MKRLTEEYSDEFDRYLCEEDVKDLEIWGELDKNRG